jgi:hypothetical protein
MAEALFVQKFAFLNRHMWEAGIDAFRIVMGRCQEKMREEDLYAQKYNIAFIVGQYGKLAVTHGKLAVTHLGYSRQSSNRTSLNRIIPQSDGFSRRRTRCHTKSDPQIRHRGPQSDGFCFGPPVKFR